MKKELLLCMIILALVMQACQLGGGKGTIPDASEAFKGKEGLILSFFENAPPEKVIPGSQFLVAVLLENKGATDISCESDSESCGYFVVFSKDPITKIEPATGALKNALELSNSQHTIVGKESYHSGGKAALEMTAEVSNNVARTTSATINVNACYPYQTDVTTSVCVQSAHYTVSEKNLVCKPRTLTFSGQGAPVAITKIEQDTLYSGTTVRPRLTLYIADVGKGTVIDRSTTSLSKACTSDNTNLDEIIGRITIETATLSGRALTCQGKSLTLSGITSKDFIECIATEGFESGAANNLVSPLKIVLKYGYQTAISKEVKIEVLDSPPKIHRFDAPEKTSSSEPIRIFIAAEDDFGVSEIHLLDSEGKLIAIDKLSAPNNENPFPCNDKPTCEVIFTVSHSLKTGDTYSFKTMAYDNSEPIKKPSVQKTAFGTIKGPPTVEIAMPQNSLPDTKILITVTATDDTGVEKIELLDENDKVLESRTCDSGTTCTEEFTVTTPSGESTPYTYKARATDYNEEQTTAIKEGKTAILLSGEPD